MLSARSKANCPQAAQICPHLGSAAEGRNGVGSGHYFTRQMQLAKVSLCRFQFQFEVGFELHDQPPKGTLGQLHSKKHKMSFGSDRTMSSSSGNLLYPIPALAPGLLHLAAGGTRWSRLMMSGSPLRETKPGR